MVSQRGRACTSKTYNDDNGNDANDNEDYDDYVDNLRPKKAKPVPKAANVKKTKVEAVSQPRTFQKLKAVEQLHITTGEILHIYHQVKDAAAAMGITQCSITSCCTGKQLDSSGFKWKYYTGPDVTLEEIAHTLTPILDLLDMKVTNKTHTGKRKNSEIDNSANKVSKIDSTINTPISVTVPAVVTVYKSPIKSPVKVVSSDSISSIGTSKQNASSSKKAAVNITNRRSPAKVVNKISAATTNTTKPISISAGPTLSFKQTSSGAIVSNPNSNANLIDMNVTLAELHANPNSVVFDLSNDSDDDDSVMATMIDLTAAQPLISQAKISSKASKNGVGVMRNLFTWFTTKK